ncbi:ORF6N domain-containing protein [Janthinobacterium sp. UMAB-56]|uniref:ORF6N domain-containing protein n=1 Tax=Janthinobacterium sp. UMAB-56 TaxID=1365361 RepID=UPI001C55BBFC|nr:ORF6N domain-containing protein [Janthinobacterium sp. UMAB-56]
MNDRVSEELLASAAGRYVSLQALKVRAAALPKIRWKGQNVITTELLAKLYGTDVKNVQMNYSRNAARFDEGIHFFKVSGKTLVDLRPTLSGSQISAKTRSLMLWTERGATRHAKMIETDQAWDMFVALEDHYFKQFEVDPDSEPSTAEDRRPLHIAAYDLAVKNRGLISAGHTIHNEAAGSTRYSKMTKGGVKVALQASRPLIDRTATESDFVRMDSRKRRPTKIVQLELGLSDPGPSILE